MDCPSVRNQLIFLAENNTDPALNQKLQEHLQGCSDCREQFVKLQATLSLLPGMKQSNPNPFLFTRIEEQLRNQARTRVFPAFGRVLQPVLVSALLITTVFLGIFLLQNNRPSESPSSANNNAVIASQYHLNTSDQDLIETYYLTEE